MIHRSVDATAAKGWFIGPWDSDLPIPVGWATQGIAERHVHRQMVEIYLVARGASTIDVNGESTPLRAGDMLVVEPGEIHTFTWSSDDYLHFVIHAPFVQGDKEIVE